MMVDSDKDNVHYPYPGSTHNKLHYKEASALQVQQMNDYNGSTLHKRLKLVHGNPSTNGYSLSLLICTKFTKRGTVVTQWVALAKLEDMGEDTGVASFGSKVFSRAKVLGKYLHLKNCYKV